MCNASMANHSPKMFPSRFNLLDTPCPRLQGRKKDAGLLLVSSKTPPAMTFDPTAFGELDPLRQKYDCHVKDFEGLLKLSGGRPFANWTKDVHTVTLQDFTSWFPRDENRIAIYGAKDQEGLSYADLHDQIKACPSYTHKTTVTLILPLDLRLETAVALVALLSQPHVCVAPLDYNMPKAKMLEAFKQLDCTGIVTTAALLQNLKAEEALSGMKDIRIIESTGTKAGAINWKILNRARQYELPVAESGVSENEPRMLLRTSGTTASPKVVALSASHLLHSGASLAFGLNLSSDDVACCAMPLFHIGGIAGALLCVLVSGSSVVMMPGNFDPQAFLDRLDPSFGNAAPTWYYAAPTMHQALLLTAKSQDATRSYIPNKLRLIRSAAAHLPHEIAMELADLFHTSVFPTYGMSECMPICIPLDPIVWNRESNAIGSVGQPAACSVAIVNSTGDPLPYGEIGEIAVSGPGAIKSYVGMSPSVTHTPSGWLKTGDVGYLDSHGRLFIKGRSKEMIKRGGEQVWPNEVDRVVLGVTGVKAAVTFAVPNALWGEEVAVAVVLDKDDRDEEASRQLIMATCKEELDHFAVPHQLIFVESTAELPKGASGKYLRTRMADHLGTKSVDTCAMSALKAAGATVKHEMFSDDPAKGVLVKPSHALNGTRFVTACFVVQLHIGFFPSIAWTKIQSFSMSMPIFFFLVAFQMACNAQTEVLSSWSSFVGSKIGSMHALFVVAHFLALPSYLMFHFGLTGYTKFPNKLRIVAGQLLTGMFGYYDGNCGTTWFQSVVYAFLILFPWLDRWLRRLPDQQLLKFGAVMILASIIIPSSLFAMGHLESHFTIVTWLPNLVSAMIAGYLFKRFHPARAKDGINSVSLLQKPQFWGLVTDTMSVCFLLLLVAVALAPNCLSVELDTFLEMRPNAVEYEAENQGDEVVVWACNVTWDEFVNFVHNDQENWETVGRWEVEITHAFWDYRLGTPLVMIWLYGLAFGRGITARIMKSRLLQFLAPLSYPIYLLHVPVARYYWLATRGFEAKQWWGMAGDYPVPVGFHEMLLILGISAMLGYVIDRHLLLHVIPYTVNAGVFVCQSLSKCVGNSSNTSTAGTLIFEQVQHVVKALLGIDVSHSSRLDSLGLDSLGSTAFLGALRASLPKAKRMSLQKLSVFDTVGDLVDFLCEKEGASTLAGIQEVRLKTRLRNVTCSA